MIPPAIYAPITCAVCKQDRYSHRRDNQECVVFERAEVKPVVYRARPQAAATGWRVRSA